MGVFYLFVKLLHATVFLLNFTVLYRCVSEPGEQFISKVK